MKVHHIAKHLFIPHEGNEYRPHFFRELSIILILIVSIFLLGVSFGSSFFIHKTVLGSSVASSVLVDLTNNSRIAYNEQPLTINTKLQHAAFLKGQDMSSLGYFAHESPTGVTPWYWFKQAGYTFLYAGENLAINFTESNDVESAWMASPKHKENILNTNFREIGISTVEGLYHGNPTTYVVQMFGTPAVEVAEAAIIPVKVATTPNKTPEIVNKNVAMVSTTVANVKGEATSTPKVASSFASNILSIFKSPTLSIVKNTDNVKEIAVEKDITAPQYSVWYEKLLFGGSWYVQMIYQFMIMLIALALIVMIFIEIKRQHPKHIIYGVLMLAILIVFVFINKSLIY
ncbi:MAG: CAP domain-containing protein [Candidatus Nomurabacteria bacterium]